MAHIITREGLCSRDMILAADGHKKQLILVYDIHANGEEIYYEVLSFGLKSVFRDLKSAINSYNNIE